MYKCYIITAYIIGNLSSLLDNKKGDYIICADGGYALAAKEKIVPNLVIGDFDSYKGTLPAEIKTIILPKEKDETDTLACVKYAITLGFKEIVILGGTGGRLDHTIANIQCLYYGAKNGISIVLRDEKNIVSVHLPSSFRVEKYQDYKLSLFAFSQICEGVTIRGLKYPLSDYTLDESFPLGVSNEFIDDFADISFKKGVLLLILSRD